MSRQPLISAPGRTGAAGSEYIFPLDIMNGPLQHPTNGQALFLITTPAKLIGKRSTTVTLPDGTSVASIKWGGLFQSKTVTFHAQTMPIKQALKRKRKHGKLIWVDTLGDETFAWRNGLIYSPQSQVVGKYTRGRKHSIRQNDPAMLLIDDAHRNMIDRFLVTAIMIEHAKRESERSSSGGDGGGEGC